MNSKLNAPGAGSFSGVGLYGVTGGVTAGFDYQIGQSAVVGLMADGNVGSVSAKDTIAGTGDLTYRETASWALRGRLGWSPSDDALVYGTIGFSQVRTSLSVPAGLLIAGGGATYSGVVFGAGVETRLSGNLYGRVEYLHALYGQKSFQAGLFTARPSTGAFKVGLIWRPGGDMDAPDGVAIPARGNWTGVYGGLYGGWSWANTRLSSNNVFHADGIGGNGPIGGVLLGYDYQFNQTVAGLEADIGASSNTATLSGAGFNGRIAYDMTYGARARVGQIFGNTLLFAAVGVTATHGRLSSFGLGVANVSNTFVGVQFGGGAETMLTANVGARIEYMHAVHGKFASINGSTTDAGLTNGTTRAAMIYKF